MKKRMNFWFSALMFCAAVGVLWGCADKSVYEPEEQAQKREQFKEKLSHEVTQTEARENLEKLLTKLNIPSTRGGDAKLPPITSVYTTGKAAEMTRAGEEVEPYFHIFNFGDNEGFAIMSGDDRVEPLLALTFKGELTPETEIDNPGFEIAYEKMEDYYIARIGFDTIPSIQPDLPIPPRDSLQIPDLELPARTESTEEIEYYNGVFGLCPVQWGQTDPYNIYCGLPELGLNVYTGCVATATAQLMSIHKHPNSYNGYTFNWDEMNQFFSNDSDKNPYRSDSTKIKPIARLMQQLGLNDNLDVQYEVIAEGNGSSANTADVPQTLINFGYSNGGTLIDYNTTAVVNELKAGYPVLLRGNAFREENKVLGISFGYRYTGGHAWVGHGLMERSYTVNAYNEFDELLYTSTTNYTYILCNFGWDGWQDGYYSTGIFNANEGPSYIPDETRSVEGEEGNYQYNIETIINIRK